MLGAAVDLVADRGPVSLCLRSPVEAPEDAHEKVRLQRRLRPVHPAVDLRTLAGIVGPEALAAMARGQIAQDRVRLPHDHAVIVDDRDATVRIHGPELGRIEAAELTAGFDMPMFKPQFANQPQDLLQVEGTAPPPDRQHFEPKLPRHTRRAAVAPRRRREHR